MDWTVPPRDGRAEERLSASLGLMPLTCHLLRNRGFSDPEDAARFLHPRLSELHDPALLADMDAAVARIRRALVEKEPIVIHGDYDADGVTATALLLRFFKALGADASWHIPDRLDEGYGLHAESMEALARGGAKLLLTVDCGTTAHAAVDRARACGMDVVVTDHHEPSGPLPACAAVVNPKREDETYPFRDLSGVGVAFKLAWALARDAARSPAAMEELKGFLAASLGLVALGTVADVVSLSGENRILVKHGLKALAQSRHAGERALLACAGTDRPEADDLAFRMGPRINAAGRMGDSRTALELLVCDAYDEALGKTKALERMNRKRQEIEKRILVEVEARILAEGLHEGPAIVVEGEGWHPGVIGIVAARVADAFHRPTVLVALDGAEGRGSARSIPAFNLHAALVRCAPALASFGGHAQAAGLTVRRDRLEDFRAAFCAAARELAPADLVPRLDVEAEVSLAELDNSFLAELELFRPFGKANPEPVLAVRGGRVAGRPRLIGAGGKHLSFYFREGETAFRAVGFGFGDRIETLEGSRLDLAFTPFLNRFGGRENFELRVRDLRVLGGPGGTP